MNCHELFFDLKHFVKKGNKPCLENSIAALLLHIIILTQTRAVVNFISFLITLQPNSQIKTCKRVSEVEYKVNTLCSSVETGQLNIPKWSKTAISSL